MDEVMRHVVSEPDDMAAMMMDNDHDASAAGGSVQSSRTDHSPQQWGLVRQPTNHSNDWASSKPPHAPFTTIENHNHRLQDTHYDSSSTLSNDEHENDPDEDDVPLAYFPAHSYTSNSNTANTTTNNTTNNTTTTQNTPTLLRSSSRCSSSSSSLMAPSSQTSSRDWGWFDDVNMSDRKLTKPNHKDDKNNNSDSKKKKTKIPNTMMEDNGMYERMNQQSGCRVIALLCFV
jgi:hypothetical protein